MPVKDNEFVEVREPIFRRALRYLMQQMVKACQDLELVNKNQQVQIDEIMGIIANGVPIKSFGTAGDAFGRLRVSNLVNIFDSKQDVDNSPDFWDDSEVSGSGTTSTHSTNTASTVMGVSAATAGRRIRQTFMRFNYQPGNSTLVFMTGTFNITGGGAGITQRIGQFDDKNGIYFFENQGIISVAIRSFVTGAAVDLVKTQSEWNVDKMDGKGPSKFLLNPSITPIMFFDYEWLSVGQVRIGFVISGVPVIVHVFEQSGVAVGAYMSTPNNPLRYEIENDGTGAASSMEHICATVKDEGGETELGVTRYASTNGTHIDADTENIVYAILGIRLQAAKIGTSIDIDAISIQIQTASETGEWTLRFNPTIASSGTVTWSAETNSSVEIGVVTNSHTITGGTKVAGGFSESASGGGGSGGERAIILDERRLGAAIDGTVDELILCWMPNGGSSGHDIEGKILWRELS